MYASRNGGGGGGDSGSGSPGNGDAGPTTTAVLYGVVGSPAMMDFHRVLKAAAAAGTVRYAFRHALPHGGGEGDGGGGVETATVMATTAMTTPLQGYGVVLDVKNMEYQSFDSSDSENEVRASVCERGNKRDAEKRHTPFTARDTTPPGPIF